MSVSRPPSGVWWMAISPTEDEVPAMNPAAAFDQGTTRATGPLRAELVLTGEDERVIVVDSEAELTAQFAQLARGGWELRRTVQGPDLEDGVTRLTLEFAPPSR